MTDSYPIDLAACTPDVPDVQGAIDKAKETAKGKIAKLDFRPVDFTIDIDKYISFEIIFKILGKPEGLGYDMCAITIDGDVDAAIAGSPFPNGAEEWTIGINNNLNDMQDQIDNIETPEGTFSLDSAVSYLWQQVDSVSDLVDSAGI